MRSLTHTLLSSFATMPDPRAANSVHSFDTILFVTIVGVLSGADGFVQIERLANARRKLIEQYVDISAGIPTHDTIARVFQALDPDAFREAFRAFIAELTAHSAEDIISLDGKTLRGALKKSNTNEAMALDQVHIVSAYSKNRQLVLGQLRSSAVANEQEAVRELLGLIDVSGCVVTADAAHCSPGTIDRAKERGGDMVVCLKKNTPHLWKTAERTFKEWSDDVTEIRTEEEGHGRKELRLYELVAAEPQTGPGDAWAQVKTFVRVTRRQTRPQSKTVSDTQVFYVSTLPVTERERIAEAIRSHWQIENALHWTLDVAFHEDHCRVRTKNAAENLSRVRHIALSLLKQDTTEKVGVATKRTIAGASDDYLRTVLRLKEPPTA